MRQVHVAPRLRARLQRGRRHRFRPRARGARRAPSTWCWTSAPRRCIDWHAPPQGYFHLPGGVAHAAGAADAAAPARDWSANSRSRSSSTTSRSCAPTAATRRSAATPASRSVRPRRSPATRRASASRSIPTCASAAAPAPPCARPARWATPIRARPTRALKLRTLLSDLRAGRRRATRRCCCTARSAARRWSSELGRAARSSARPQGVPANVIPVGAVARGQHRHRPVAERRGASARRRSPCWPRAKKRRSTWRRCRQQMEIAQAMLRGPGLRGHALQLIEAAHAGRAGRARCAALRDDAAAVPAQRGPLRRRAPRSAARSRWRSTT